MAGGSKPSPFPAAACDDAGAPGVKITAPADGAHVPTTFTVTVDATDDCGVTDVHIEVQPANLQASATAAPFEWKLNDLVGRQTITIAATDGSGKTAAATIEVEAGGGAAPSDTPPSARKTSIGGCRMSGGTGSSVIVLLVWAAGLGALRPRRNQTRIVGVKAVRAAWPLAVLLAIHPGCGPTESAPASAHPHAIVGGTASDASEDAVV